MTIVKCDYCGKEFNKQKSALKRTKSNFCNDKCFFNSRKTNKIIINNGYAVIQSKNKYGVKNIIIDIEDLDKVTKYHWNCRAEKVNNNFYAIAHGEGNKTVLIHRLIMNCPSGKVIDHINHDGLDNRKSNLRICEHYENMQNVKSKGYYRNKDTNKWYAYITFKYKKTFFGGFNTEEEAKKARLDAEEKYFKYKSEIKC